jgi:hypothetical protein
MGNDLLAYLAIEHFVLCVLISMANIDAMMQKSKQSTVKMQYDG